VHINDHVASGFLLALYLFESLEIEYDREALFQRLAEVANGETILFNSPEEEFMAYEKRLNRAATPQERENFLREFADSKDENLHHRVTAGRVLEVHLREQ
jgi:hypothetical protein